MQVHNEAHSERRSGSERRKFGRSAGISASELHWNGISFDPTTDGEGTYDPYDPYWEPLKGQDDD